MLYHIHLANGLHVRLRAFLVYDTCGETEDRTIDDNGVIRKYEW